MTAWPLTKIIKEGIRNPEITEQGRNYIDAFHEYQEELPGMTMEEMDAALDRL